MDYKKKIKVGIGFATGRKSFQKILKTYIHNWRECGLTENEDVSLNLIVAYDLEYFNTKETDYTNINQKLLGLIDDAYFIGKNFYEEEVKYLIDNDIITKEEAHLLFESGYAAKRNSVLYTAIKNGMDYLIFLDDDEYPVAVTNTRSSAVWGGQHVIKTHLENIKNADITNGYHCGYISPIPYMDFNQAMTENDFRYFIESISNDIINWDKIRKLMNDGGVTYADTKILTSDDAVEAEEINNTKFISGANLCINLTDPKRVLPFYNPPGARGEDTFLSTCLSERKVLRVPCYTFHDGFSTYNHLMDGVLPVKLKYIKADSEAIINRFYKACIGWIRYKPLLLYITQRENYNIKIEEMRENLRITLPKICNYFKKSDFMNISDELEKYHVNVNNHYMQFLQTQNAWSKINQLITQNDDEAAISKM